MFVGYKFVFFKMKLTHIVILSGILHNFIPAAFCCSPPENWLLLNAKARVQKAELVIHGTVRGSPRRGPKDDVEGLYSALFEVHCILKGEMLPRFINVSGFGFAGGLCTRSDAYLNKTYVALLRKDDIAESKRPKFTVNEVNVQSATIPTKHKEGQQLLKEIMEIVGKNTSQPLGATKDALPGCTKLVNQPSLHPSKAGRESKRNPCQHRSRRHKKRKNKRCRALFSSTSTQMITTTTEMSTSKSFLSSTKQTKDDEPSTVIKNQGFVEYILSNNSAKCQMQSVCWCFVLTLHGLVLAVIKWQQT